MIRRLRTMTSVAVALAMACSLAACSSKDKSADTTPAAQATSVGTARAKSQVVATRVRLSGRVVPLPERDAVLAFATPGPLAAVTVHEGDAVKAGQTLARMDAAVLEGAISTARAEERRAASDLDAKRRAAERTRSLVGRGVAAAQDAETDEAAASAAQAAVDQARVAVRDASRQRDRAELVAPFDGVVLHVLRRAGEQLEGASTPVLELASASPVEIAASAGPDVLSHVAPGQAATITLPGDAAPRIAKVVRIARSVDQATGLGELRFALDESAGPLPVLGSPADVALALDEATALVVPAASVRRDATGGAQVVVVKDSKAHLQDVVLGRADGDVVEVTTGVQAGDEVVVDDPLSVEDGAAVTVR